MLACDIEKLKLDAFRCEFTGLNMGILCNFISYTKGEYTMRKIAGITFIHNVLPRPGTAEDLDFISKLWKIIDKYDLARAKWNPYWLQSFIETDDEKSYVSFYETDERIIIAAVNHNTSRDEIGLCFKSD